LQGAALTLCAATALAVLLVACDGDAEPTATPPTAPPGSPTPVPDLFDFGSAPEPFPSSLEANGARHADLTRAWIGDKVDGEEDLDRKDDNDGLAGADPVAFVVTNNDWEGDLFVNVLIDVNGDGDWTDGGEWILRNRKVVVAPGSDTEVSTDFVLDRETWMRITLTDVELSGFDGTGEFEIGETEDHRYTLRGQ
jgi:hypothetical protein